MPDIKLVAETGRIHGSATSRRLRHEGKIPGVVYGHGISAVPVSIDARALRSALTTTAGTNVVLELDVDGTNHLAMAKQIQRHPVKGTVAHIDFLVVSRHEAVTVDVPLVLVGESAEIKAAGGGHDQYMHSLTVSTTPAQIPESVEVDLSDLTVGGSIRVGDLKLPSGVSTEVDPETLVVSGHGEVIELAVEAEPAEAALEVEGAAADEAGEGGGSGGDRGASGADRAEG